MSTPAMVRKYAAFLALYEHLRSHPGVWVDKHGAAEVMGMSNRQARRWILLYQNMKHPHIEAVVGKAGHTDMPSMLRWTP